MTEQWSRDPAGMGPTTIVQKVVHPALAELHLGNVTVPGRFEPHRTAGFALRGRDTFKIKRNGQWVDAHTADEKAELYGLDKVPGWPMSGPLYVLRYQACHQMLYTTPFGGQNEAGAGKMHSHIIYPPPFLGTGSTPAGVPEYWLELSELVAGTEMWCIHPDGRDERVGLYVNRQMGWIPTAGASFGPRRWWTPPAPLRPTVRRGLAVKYCGMDFDADFGPEPGSFTLHPMPGMAPPDDFDEREGTRSKRILDAQADEIRYLRNLCTWRQHTFEIIDLTANEAVLHFLGENYLIARELKLTEVDRCVWRTIVSRSEMTEFRQEIRTIEPGLLRTEGQR